MSDILIVADDLTGANATAAGITRRGLRAVSVRVGADHDKLAEVSEEYDALVVTTDSRHSSPVDAARAVSAVVEAVWPVRFVASRCDSTLRGNVGAEAQACIEAVRRLSGAPTHGLAIPAFPSAERLTVAGRQLFQGHLLENTELARDVRSPITTSYIPQILAQDADLRSAVLGIGSVIGDEADLDAALLALLADDPDVIVADALTDAHILASARAALRVRPDVNWVGIDPGPGSWAIIEAMGMGGRSRTKPLLALSGSATELTRRQLGHLMANRAVTLVRPVFPTGEHVPDVAATVARVVDAVDESPAPIILLASVLSEEDLRPLSEQEAIALPEALGRIAAGVLEHAEIGGLFTTGGDITAASLDAIGGIGIEVTDEVVPLAVAGSVVGGPHAHLPIATKGGLVGDDATVVACLDVLSQHVLAASRTSPAIAT